MSLNEDSLTFKVGNTATLIAAIAPDNATNKTVVWSSDNTAVATVDTNGKVTALSTGTATITVTTVDGNKTATCTVIVTAKTYGISVSPSSLDFGSVTEGYQAVPAAQTVTITNTGNHSVTLTKPTSTSYVISPLSNPTIAAGETATFSIQPKAGLSAGNYVETLIISCSNGTSVSVPLSFDVDLRSSSSSGSSGGGSYSGPVGVYYADGRTDEAASDVTSGTWEQKTASDGNISWRFKLADGSYAVGRWVKALWNDQYLWYHMDENGYLQGGWFTDTDGNIYYLHPFHDGNFGYMYTGDHIIDGTVYSFSKGREQDGLPEGALIR